MLSRSRFAMYNLGLLGAVAVAQQGFVSWRASSMASQPAREIAVTSLADDGPGTLREAIFETATSPGTQRIALPAGRIVLQSPLPPLVNRSGVVMAGLPAKTIIDASAITHGPAVDVDAPTVTITGVSFIGAPEQALLVRRNGLRIADSSFVGCNHGVHLLEGVDQARVERSTFQDNAVGVFVSSPQTQTVIAGNRFGGHREAALWAVAKAPSSVSEARGFSVSQNRFQFDRFGVVVVNTPAIVETNEFVGSQEFAVFLGGPGAVIRGNRIHRANGIGVSAEQSRGAVIEGNEIDDSRAIGILVRSSESALVRNNRIIRNGYGIAFVFGARGAPNAGTANLLLRQAQDGFVMVGDSPVLQRNKVFNSGLSAFRALDYVSLSGARTRSEPLLMENVAEGNRFDAVMRGDYPAVRVGEGRR